MSFDQAAAFFLFSLVAAGTPGPSNVLLTSTGGQAGLWRGLPSGFVWLSLGAALQRLMRDARWRRIFNLAMGLALAASVILILR